MLSDIYDFSSDHPGENAVDLCLRLGRLFGVPVYVFNGETERSKHFFELPDSYYLNINADRYTFVFGLFQTSDTTGADGGPAFLDDKSVRLLANIIRRTYREFAIACQIAADGGEETHRHAETEDAPKENLLAILDFEQAFDEALENEDFMGILTMMDPMRETMKDYYKTDLRKQKNALIFAVSKLGKLAIGKGVSPEAALGMNHRYFAKVEALESVEQTVPLLKTMLKEYFYQCRRLNTQNCSLHVGRAVKYIRNHPYEPLTPRKVAERIGVSVKYLSSLFACELSTSLGEFIHSEKIKQARILLTHSDRKIIEISNLLGYPSPSYFSAKFKKIAGCSPREYKAKES